MDLCANNHYVCPDCSAGFTAYKMQGYEGPMRCVECHVRHENNELVASLEKPRYVRYAGYLEAAVLGIAIGTAWLWLVRIIWFQPI